MDAERPGRLAEQLEFALEQLATKPMVAGQVLREVEQVTQLYHQLDGQPAWVDGEGLTTAGSDLLHILEATRYEGLNSSVYHLSPITELQQQIASEADAAIAEVLAARAARAAEIAEEMAALVAAQAELDAAREEAEAEAAEEAAQSDDDEDADEDDASDEDDAADQDDEETVDDEDSVAEQAEEAPSDITNTAVESQHQLPPPVAPPPRLGLLVDLELLLSDAFLHLARHRAEGVVDPNSLTIGWHLPLRKLDYLASSATAVTEGRARAFLQSLKPPAAEYLALETALQRYTALAAKGGWPIIPAGSMLKLGEDDSQRVPLLRKRLHISGDMTAEAAQDEDEEFDMDLHRAVKHFQARHGLKADGVVGPNTLYMLNIPVEARVESLRVSLERWRWLPTDLGSTHIRVNVPGYQMAVYEENTPVLSMPVIVGQPDRQTPNFSETMKYLVANPTWEVPPSIAKKDKLPILRENLGYLTEHGFEVLKGWGKDEVKIDPTTLDWTTYNEKFFPFHLRQNPGPTNALGRIKFMLPNKYNIYLHDTPGKHLFTASARAFSSGCIRLERPLELADYILGRDARWQGKDIRQILEGEPKQILRLKKHIPVHILYFTAWVDEQGVVNFREDVYNRDREVLGALHQKTGV